MGMISKVHSIVWVDGYHAVPGYHVVRFRNCHDKEMAGCVFDRPGFVTLVRLGTIATVYPVHATHMYENDLRAAIENDTNDDSRVNKFKAAVRSIEGADPDWCGREMVVPVRLRDRMFEVRYTIESIGRNSNGRPVIMARSSRGKQRTFTIDDVLRYLGEQPRPRTRVRAIDLEV